MKKRIYIVLSLLAVAVVAFCLLRGQSKAVSPQPSEKPTVAKQAKVKRPRQMRSATNRVKKVSRKMPPQTQSTAEGEVVDAWVEDLPEKYRKLGQALVDASDNDNLEALKKMRDEVKNCTNADVRERYVDALGWFGKDAVVELTGFLSDADESVAQSAFNAWESAVDQTDDESFQIGATVAAMETLKNEDSLRSAAAKFESAEDKKAAINAIVQVMESDNKAAHTAAKEAYEFVVGEEWKGAATARVKALTIDQEEE